MNTKKTIGIVFAMKEELAVMIKLLPPVEALMLHHCLTAIIDFDQYRLCMIEAGIGKVNAAIATTLLIKEYQPDLIINAGIAGAVSAELKTGDVVLSDACVYYDVDASVFGYQHGQVPRMPTHYQSILPSFEYQGDFALKVFSGRTCTGDSFLTSKDSLNKINQYFDDIFAVDMEAAAIAQTCHQLSVPFLIIKGISDHVDSDSTEDSEKNVELAMSRALEVLMSLLASNVFLS